MGTYIILLLKRGKEIWRRVGPNIDDGNREIKQYPWVSLMKMGWSSVLLVMEKSYAERANNQIEFTIFINIYTNFFVST